MEKEEEAASAKPLRDPVPSVEPHVCGSGSENHETNPVEDWNALKKS